MKPGIFPVILFFLVCAFIAGTGDHYVKGKPVKVEQEPAPVTRDEKPKSVDELCTRLARVQAQLKATENELQELTQSVQAELGKDPLPLPREVWK